MKIAITSQGQTLDSAVDLRFGRAAGFVVVDTETQQTSFSDNAQNLTLAQGAGIQAAQNVARTGAEAVITGHVGPKAYAALHKGGIKIYLGANGTVDEALKAFQAGTLEPADSADKEGHW
ncbi:NifB/NifX family molybdenum-iron cluster-binding protein [Desulfobaculum bizertense]|uniref:Predicted Fe-Mo cluster-binding protein, NifX family n=1 Tax=Desulfobaculum bizertense DSM 18034 TaxID=1121442 RepID=A0A1T4VTJ5_9BACT|nr:NifB/NifX family molybdenum-iron cluster-binding protein [Desulfobaculum bizertense]UIJ38463.1 NifB/NifX family molybdenum-iron cluster-binding protein [Desulfobaculum bizertense]SKA68334.1 Predicted Fe-Mo cluster-binding protein, NifX family [Desulfobaculum bizertense DSM 18034]